MKIFKLTLALATLLIDTIYLVNPWKVIYTNINWLIDLTILISLISSSLYLAYIIKNKALKSFFFAITFISVLPLFTILISEKPKQSTYLKLYTKANNKSETISVIHTNIYTSSKNTIIHQIKYDSFNIILQRKFNKTNLNGLWIIHSKNPFHDNSGTYYFENGKILNPTQD